MIRGISWSHVPPCLLTDIKLSGVNLACTFSFSVKDEGLLGADLSLSSCVVDLPQGPCRNGVCSRALIHFSPVTDFVKDGNRTTQISVKSIDTQNFLWNGYSTEPVEVNRWNCPKKLYFVFFMYQIVNLSTYLALFTVNCSFLTLFLMLF